MHLLLESSAASCANVSSSYMGLVAGSFFWGHGRNDNHSSNNAPNNHSKNIGSANSNYSLIPSSSSNPTLGSVSSHSALSEVSRSTSIDSSNANYGLASGGSTLRDTGTSYNGSVSSEWSDSGSVFYASGNSPVNNVDAAACASNISSTSSIAGSYSNTTVGAVSDYSALSEISSSTPGPASINSISSNINYDGGYYTGTSYNGSVSSGWSDSSSFVYASGNNPVNNADATTCASDKDQSGTSGYNTESSFFGE